MSQPWNPCEGVSAQVCGRGRRAFGVELLHLVDHWLQVARLEWLRYHAKLTLKVPLVHSLNLKGACTIVDVCHATYFQQVELYVLHPSSRGCLHHFQAR